MIVITDVSIIGSKTGTTERGTWYNVSIVNDGEPYQISATKEAFNICNAAEFGKQMKMIAELRLYQGNWRLRAINFEEY